MTTNSSHRWISQQKTYHAFNVSSCRSTASSWVELCHLFTQICKCQPASFSIRNWFALQSCEFSTKSRCLFPTDIDYIASPDGKKIFFSRRRCVTIQWPNQLNKPKLGLSGWMMTQLKTIKTTTTHPIEIDRSFLLFDSHEKLTRMCVMRTLRPLSSITTFMDIGQRHRRQMFNII